jgi:hypothetical protein
MWDISGDFSRYARMPGYAYYTQTPFWFNDVVARYIRRTAPTIQYPPLHQN